MLDCVGYAAEAATAPLKPFSFKRRDPGPSDVAIDILYCGVCHSDLHTVRNEWKNTIYPALPGHESVGRVTAVGDGVTKFKPGDLAGVGCMVDSCRECASCREGLENYCETGFVVTYNGNDKRHGTGNTFGGYSDRIVVDESFTLRIPDNLPLEGVAPLLCAGITTYSPLKHWNVGPGKKVGIVGLGGLGHMGVKIAHAMGAHVVLFTTSPGKAEDARRLGADEVVISKDPAQMKAHVESFDFILDCVSADHPIEAYIALLKREGTLTLVGAPENPLPIPAFSLIWRRRSFAGSLIGGIAETQEMLDFCATHGLTADVEVIGIDRINEAYDRLMKQDVKYRFTIDMGTLRRA